MGADGTPAWETTMANTYGYIRGTEDADGDAMDVYLHEDMDQWNGRKVYVIDQTREDGSFDEHKVMLGFEDEYEAMQAYLANYEPGWDKSHPGLRITEASVDDFKAWAMDGKKKTRPYADVAAEAAAPETNSQRGQGGNDRADIGKTEKKAHRGMTEEEVESMISKMRSIAIEAPNVELTQANWQSVVSTPLGDVKMGANQREKLLEKGRADQYGMLLETLSHPNVILEERDRDEEALHERPTSYLFIKTFYKEDGSKYVHFESVTISKDGLEISISSHIIRENQLRKK